MGTPKTTSRTAKPKPVPRIYTWWHQFDTGIVATFRWYLQWHTTPTVTGGFTDQLLGAVVNITHNGACMTTRVGISPVPQIDPVAVTDLPAKRTSDRTSRGRFAAGNKAGAVERVRLTELGLGVAPDCPHKYRQFLRWARKYAKHRRGELAQAHGSISAAVGIMIETAAQHLAAANYIRYLSTRTKSGQKAKDFLALSVRLSAESRNTETMAWNLAKMEAEQRNRMPTTGGLLDIISSDPQTGDTITTPALPPGTSNG